MKLHEIPSYRRTTELEAEAMINEGGAIRQPSMREADNALANLRRSAARSAWQRYLPNPITVFLATFVAGLAIGMLRNRPHGNT